MGLGQSTAGRWVLFGLALAVSAGSGYGAYQLAGYSWDQVAAYESPYLGTLDDEVGSALVTVPPAPRVVLVIVDGLREDAARQMATLNNVQAYGSDYSLVTPQPSLSYPNWTAILTGAPHHVSGVTTNWWEGRVGIPTILDQAIEAGKTTAVVGPTDFSQLYGVERADASQLRDWPKGGYIGGMLVDDALVLAEQLDPALLIVHIPDTDEAAHEHGGTSREYLEVVRQVDADLSRLVVGLQDDRTAFVIVADHGHIDTGGHGGWEPEAVRVRLVMGGRGVGLDSGEARLVDVAPTVAALMGLAPPAYSQGAAIESALTTFPPAVAAAAAAQRAGFASAYVEILGGAPAAITAGEEQLAMDVAEAGFMRRGRDDRLLLGIVAGVACLAVLAVIGVASRPALLAALAGAAAYSGVYNALFFWLHGFHWSLSAFNTEDMVESFMNGRLVEAAASTVVAAAVAAVAYPAFRRNPEGARGEHLPGWLALGPATALAVLSVLGLQVAWYVWAWGPAVTALLPDLKWGFKYDLDLIQATAVGLAGVVTPFVTLVVGLYHPMVRRARAARTADAAGE